MAQYLIRKGPIYDEIAKFDDTSEPVDVYVFTKRGCSCPASMRNCKHTRIYAAWNALKKPIGVVFNDSADVINTINFY